MPQYLVAIHHPDNFDPSTESEATVRAIDGSAAADDYRWSSVILGIVKSAPFQMRTAGQANQVPVTTARK